MTYPEARDRLSQIVQELRGADLDTALKLWDEAQTCRQVCEDFIAAGERKLIEAGVVQA